eukprot:g25416.t2
MCSCRSWCKATSQRGASTLLALSYDICFPLFFLPFLNEFCAVNRLECWGTFQREETHQSRGQLVRQLLRLLRGRDFLWLGLGCAGLVLSSLAELASPPLAAAALFSAVQGRHHLLLPRCAAVAGVAVLSGAAEGLRNFSFNMLRSNLELSFFDEADGELTSRLSSDCMSVYSYLSDVLSFFLRSGAVALCSLLELLRLSPSITWRVLLMLTLVMVCAEWYGRVTRSTGRKTQDFGS